MRQRFDHQVHDAFRRQIERHDGSQHDPAGIDRRGEKYGNGRGDEHADHRHEAQQHGDNAPENGIGNADHPEAGADRRAKAGIHHHQGQKIRAQPGSGIFQRHRRLFEIMRADEADGAIAHVALFQQQEDHEDDDDAEPWSVVKGPPR